MALFARSYGRQLPPPQTRPSGQNAETLQPEQVRVTGGPLAGLTGRVIFRLGPDRWLVETDEPGLLLRVDPQLLTPVSSG